ncbi:MAG: hypothetical protein JWQ63_3502 [Mucilaginibacter sp.]|jgi:hypothetical protein|nr:hypothetical protein [Mucilaginibacter sp.]
MGYKSEIELPDNKMNGNIEDPDLEYWSNEFGISKDELIAAVKSGKTPAEAVEKYVQELEFAV